MKSKYINQIIVLCFSIILIIIGIRYSEEPGFIIGINKVTGYVYSTELMSSGGDDFYTFIGLNAITNYMMIFVCILSIIINIFTKKRKKIFIILFYIIYSIQAFFLFLINLDIPISYMIKYRDLYFILWLTIFIIEFIIVNIIEIIIWRIKAKSNCA